MAKMIERMNTRELRGRLASLQRIQRTAQPDSVMSRVAQLGVRRTLDEMARRSRPDDLDVAIPSSGDDVGLLQVVEAARMSA